MGQNGSREKAKKRERRAQEKKMQSQYRTSGGNTQPNIVYDAQRKVWVPLSEQTAHLARPAITET